MAAAVAKLVQSNNIHIALQTATASHGQQDGTLLVKQEEAMSVRLNRHLPKVYCCTDAWSITCLSFGPYSCAALVPGYFLP